MTQQIDVEALANSNFNVSIISNKIEHPKDARARRFKDITLFIISLSLILIVFIFCGDVLVNQKYTPDFQKWAMTMDGSIVAAFLAFLAGKNLK